MRGTLAVRPVEGITKLQTFPGSIGATTGAVFVVDKPPSKAKQPPLDMYVFVGVPASDKNLVTQMQNITDPSNLQHFTDHRLLVSGYMEAIRFDLWDSDEDKLEAKERSYIELVDDYMSYGPNGGTGAANVFLLAQTIDLVTVQTVPFRCSVATDRVQYWHDCLDYPKNSQVKVTSDGDKMGKVKTSLPSFIFKGVSPKNISLWGANDAVKALINEVVSSGQALALEGRLLRKEWTTDSGEVRENLQISATFVFPHPRRDNAPAPVATQVANATVGDTTEAAATALGLNAPLVDDF